MDSLAIFFLLPLLLAAVQSEVLSDHYSHPCGADKKLVLSADVNLSDAVSVIECASLCSRNEDCAALNYDPMSDTCEGFSTAVLPAACDDPALIAQTGYRYMVANVASVINANVASTNVADTTVVPSTTAAETTVESTTVITALVCENGGLWNNITNRCDCEPGFAGITCQRRAVDCSEIYEYSPAYRVDDNKVYEIQAEGMTVPKQVLCYMDWGGLTIMQKRLGWDCGKISFEQDYANYTAGFGDYSCDFWLGLETIHLITNNTGRTYQMDVTIVFADDSSVQTYYTDFHVAGEMDGYLVTMGGFYLPAANAGDALALPGKAQQTMHGMKFSAFDKDQDTNPTANCASTMRGGWWFNDCGLANPNGPWGNPSEAHTPGAPAVWWGSAQYNTSAIPNIDFKLAAV